MSKNEIKILKRYVYSDINKAKVMIFSEFGNDIIKKIDSVLKEMEMTEMRVIISEILFELSN